MPLKNLFCTACALFSVLFSSAQHYDLIEKNILEEKPYQALFYLNRLDPKFYRTPAERFKYTNRRLEAHLLNKLPLHDTIEQLLSANRRVRRSVNSAYELAYFKYLEGWRLMQRGQMADAENMLGEIPRIRPELHAKIKLKLAEIYRVSGRRFSESDDFLRAAQTVFRRDSLAYFMKIYRCHSFRGLNAKDRRMYPEAESEYLKCLLILESTPEPLYDERARILNNLGNVYNESTRPAKALTAYKESIRIKEEFIRDSISLATSYGNLGQFLETQGNLVESETAYQQALATLPKLLNSRSFKSNSNTIVYNYSNLLAEFGDFSKAGVLLDAAVARSQAEPSLPRNDISMFRLHNARSQNAKRLQDFRRSLAELRLAHTIVREFSATDPLWEEYYLTASEYFYAVGQYDSSGFYARKVQQMIGSRQENKTARMGLACSKVADAEMQMGNLPEVARLLTVAYEAYEQALPSRHQSLIYTLNSLSIVYESLENSDSTIYYAGRALSLNLLPDSLRRKSGNSYLDTKEAIVSLYLLSSGYYAKFALGDQQAIRQSEEAIAIAIELIQLRRSRFSIEQDNLLFVQSVERVFRRAADIYFTMYSATPDSTNMNRLFRVAEKSKSQFLLSSMRDRQIQKFAGVTESVHRKELSLARREAQLLREQAIQIVSPTDLPPGIQSDLSAVESQKEQFVDSLKEHLPDYFELKYDRRVVDASTIQISLSEDMALVEYLIGIDYVYAIVLTKKNHAVLKLTDAGNLRAMVAQFRNNIQHRLEDDSAGSFNLPYNTLLRRVDSVAQASARPIRQLCIIPDGMLHVFPFEAIRMNTKKKLSYVVDRYQIAYNLSATLFWQKRTDRRNVEGTDLLGIAPSFGRKSGNEVSLRDDGSGDYHKNLPDLKDSGLEVETIQKIHAERNIGSTILMKEKAREMDFKAMDFRKYRFVHLATHAFANDREYGLSGLAFTRSSGGAEDDILFADEVYNLSMPCDLITLSACETGLGKYSAGEGIIGLTRPFFYAGTKSIIVSLWKVQDNSTAEFMKYFYSELLQKNTSKTEALRKAKLKMLRSKDFSNPYYWAPFVLLGGT